MEQMTVAMEAIQTWFRVHQVTPATIGTLRRSCHAWRSLGLGDDILWSNLYNFHLAAMRGPRSNTTELEFRDEYLRCVHAQIDVVLDGDPSMYATVVDSSWNQHPCDKRIAAELVSRVGFPQGLPSQITPWKRSYLVWELEESVDAIPQMSESILDCVSHYYGGVVNSSARTCKPEHSEAQLSASTHIERIGPRKLLLWQEWVGATEDGSMTNEEPSTNTEPVCPMYRTEWGQVSRNPVVREGIDPLLCLRRRTPRSMPHGEQSSMSMQEMWAASGCKNTGYEFSRTKLASMYRSMRHAVRAAAKQGKLAALNSTAPLTKRWRYNPMWETVRRIFDHTFARQICIPADFIQAPDQLDKEVMQSVTDFEDHGGDINNELDKLSVHRVSLFTASGSLSVAFQKNPPPLKQLLGSSGSRRWTLLETEGSCCTFSETDAGVTEDELDHASRARRWAMACATNGSELEASIERLKGEHQSVEKRLKDSEKQLNTLRLQKEEIELQMAQLSE